MNAKEPVLKVEGLCVDFATRKGSIRVLNDINFHVKQAESLGVVGESGCGKSMTALAIMRLIPSPPGQISKGRVLLKDKDLLSLTEKQMRDVRGNEISMIFQEPMTSLNPVFKVGMQIAENIQRHQGKSKTEAMRQAVEIMRAVKIPAARQRVNQYPHELSGGMRQRVMIAMALSCQPSVLIADEPTTALDVTVQAQIFDLLREIQEKMGTSIILITHDMGVIAENTQRVVVMYAGHKVEEGPVRQIIRNPQHPYTQGLIQCAPHLKTDPEQTREKLKEIPGFVPDLSLLDELCPFRPRCSDKQQKCNEFIPPVIQIGDNHYVACWAAGII
jgi:oligopeptide/dipeptide ABC transporter ATP-binding protein